MRDVCEIRLSDSSRVTELAVRLPQLRIVRDSGQAVAPPADRALEMLRLKLSRAREARAEGLPWYADVIDTLARNTSPNKMAARCRDMEFVLRECGGGDGAIAELLREVSREEQALHGIWPSVGTLSLSGMLGGVLGGSIGALAVVLTYPNGGGWGCVGPAIGFTGGCAAGSGIGMIVGTSDRASLIARHHDLVNDLVRRVNRAVATAP